MKTLLLALAVLTAPAGARAEMPLCAPPSCERAALPKGLHWLTNETDPTFADPRAQKGGTLHDYMDSFPLTLRQVGPDSNGSFRGYLDHLTMGLVDVQPNTRRLTPALATHWAFGRDHRTMYFELDPKATWSDGRPITAYDFSFALDFYRSKNIVAPWYNEYYTKHIEKVVVYDDRTFAIVVPQPHSDRDLILNYAFAPLPRHYYKDVGPNWVQEYQWKIAPTDGPYQITTVDMGRRIVFTRVKDWWARDLRYYKNRYNVDRVVFDVIRNPDVAWEYFKRGKLDGFTVTRPGLWHDRATGEIFDKGWVKKLWFYTDAPLPDFGMYLNMDDPLFKDRNVRLGFQYAMNVDKVTRRVLHGDYERLRGITEGYGAYTNREIPERPFSVAKADHYLALAGWKTRGPDGILVKDGRRLTATVTYGAPSQTKRLVVLKQEAAKAGIDLRLQLLDEAASFKTMLEKKHQIAYMSWGTFLLPSYWGQYDSVNAHKTQTNNFCNIADPKLDLWIHRYRTDFEDAKRQRDARMVQRLVFDSACYIPLWKVPYFRSAYWRWVRFPKPAATRLSDDPFAYPFEYGLYWIDAKAKAETEAAMRSGKSFPPSTVIDKTFKAG
ncbi:MAG: ABC transporter substrate-binding protein [Elusimicrobia bacterium]|nr:ABC transporter substrate-binding protein [Elusimicrobiota bacterium]